MAREISKQLLLPSQNQEKAKVGTRDKKRGMRKNDHTTWLKVEFSSHYSHSTTRHEARKQRQKARNATRNESSSARLYLVKHHATSTPRSIRCPIRL